MMIIFDLIMNTYFELIVITAAFYDNYNDNKDCFKSMRLQEICSARSEMINSANKLS